MFRFTASPLEIILIDFWAKFIKTLVSLRTLCSTQSSNLYLNLSKTKLHRPILFFYFFTTERNIAYFGSNGLNSSRDGVNKCAICGVGYLSNISLEHIVKAERAAWLLCPFVLLLDDSESNVLNSDYLDCRLNEGYFCPKNILFQARLGTENASSWWCTSTILSRRVEMTLSTSYSTLPRSLKHV